MGMILLMMKPLQLASRWLELCEQAAQVMIAGPLAKSLWRPNLGGNAQSRWPVSFPSLVLFPVGLLHDISWLQGKGPLEE